MNAPRSGCAAASPGHRPAVWILLIYACAVMFAGAATGCRDTPDQAELDRLRQFVTAPEKKYYLHECAARVDFIWPKGFDGKHEILGSEGFSRALFSAMMAGGRPRFVSHYTSSADYLMIYWIDQCHDREALTRQLVEERLRPRVPGFPRTRIQVDGIQPGFDGATPTDFWRE